MNSNERLPVKSRSAKCHGTFHVNLLQGTTRKTPFESQSDLEAQAPL